MSKKDKDKINSKLTNVESAELKTTIEKIVQGNDSAKMRPLFKALEKRLQKAAVLQSELRKHYLVGAPPSNGKRPSQYRVKGKKRPSQVRLYDDIIKLSEVPPKIIYHELVRAPISRAKAKQTNLKVGELSREGVGKAVNWLIEKDLKPTRGKVLDWLSKNRYTESCERHTNRLIAKAMRITQK